MRWVESPGARVALAVAGVIALATAVRVDARRQAEQGPSTPEAIEQFLLHAKVVASHGVGKGVTGIYRLTLTDGSTTHDAAFQPVDERKMRNEFSNGTAEIGFADTYHFNIAGYRLARLLGLGDMVPVTVPRTWNGKSGSLSWWETFEFDEGERLKRNLHPPDPEAWNDQMYRVRVFSALIYDTDRNSGNILITKDWKIWMIDFTRAFRRWKKIEHPADLTRIDRALFERLKAVSADDVRAAVGDDVLPVEFDALMARRDLIVDRYTKLIAKRGEAAVLY
jgi:hypothetical protein